ncbi:MAG: hypothetical protein QM627_03950 [Luteolibacter sp.]
MPISIVNNTVIAGGTSIPFEDFPKWHAYHLERVAGTQQLERDGAALIGSGFQFPQLEDFIRAVCRWGGYAGIAGRILNRNSQQAIISSFSSTIPAFACHHPASSALVALNHLSDLGTPSFASKHLRFLRPDVCPVLDRLLSQSLGYRFTPVGYQQFSTDCSTIAQQLITSGIFQASGKRWGSADVEMSIFARLHLSH